MRKIMDTADRACVDQFEHGDKISFHGRGAWKERPTSAGDFGGNLDIGCEIGIVPRDYYQDGGASRSRGGCGGLVPSGYLREVPELNTFEQSVIELADSGSGEDFEAAADAIVAERKRLVRAARESARQKHVQAGLGAAVFGVDACGELI